MIVFNCYLPHFKRLKLYSKYFSRIIRVKINGLMILKKICIEIFRIMSFLVELTSQSAKPNYTMYSKPTACTIHQLGTVKRKHLLQDYY